MYSVFYKLKWTSQAQKLFLYLLTNYLHVVMMIWIIFFGLGKSWWDYISSGSAEWLCWRTRTGNSVDKNSVHLQLCFFWGFCLQTSFIPDIITLDIKLLNYWPLHTQIGATFEKFQFKNVQFTEVGQVVVKWLTFRAIFIFKTLLFVQFLFRPEKPNVHYIICEENK